MSLLGAFIVAELQSGLMHLSTHTSLVHMLFSRSNPTRNTEMSTGALGSRERGHTFTQAGRFFRTYFKPSSSRSVRSLTVLANRALLHAFTPACKQEECLVVSIPSSSEAARHSL